MTPEERQMLAGLFDRIRSASSAPRDREAEAFIADGSRAQPYAPYILAQTVLVQEEALRAASERVNQLEAQVRDLEARAAAPAQGSGSFLGGLGKSIFGGGAPAQPTSVPNTGPWGRAAPPPPPQQPAGGWGGQPQPGPWQQPAAAAGGGGGFLKGALGAAAGVAGGVLLADSIRGMMGGHNSPFGANPGFGGGESVVNNYYGADPNAAALHDQNVRDDAVQDAADDQQYQNDQQDAIQDASDNSGGWGGGDDSTDV